ALGEHQTTARKKIHQGVCHFVSIPAFLNFMIIYPLHIISLPSLPLSVSPNTITLPSRFYTTNSPTNDPSTDKKKKGYFTRAKEMAIFYKNGIKQLFANYRLSAALTRKFRKEFSDLNRREIHLVRALFLYHICTYSRVVASRQKLCSRIQRPSTRVVIV